VQSVQMNRRLQMVVSADGGHPTLTRGLQGVITPSFLTTK